MYIIYIHTYDIHIPTHKDGLASEFGDAGRDEGPGLKIKVTIVEVLGWVFGLGFLLRNLATITRIHSKQCGVFLMVA